MTPGSELADSFHIESHEALLQRPAAAGISRRPLDAIIVPTIRPALLPAAVGLASELGCALVVLCSTPEQAGQVLAEIEAPELDDQIRQAQAFYDLQKKAAP